MTETLPTTTNGQGSLLAQVRSGAGLPADTWSDERIAAAMRFLPTAFRDPASAIGFLVLANRYDLDPFAKEIWGWEQKGRLQIMVSRDGLTKKLRHDKRVLGYEVQMVYATDEFQASKVEGGKLAVLHTTHPFAQDANPVGAYCVVRMVGEAPDLLVTRKVSDYQHLLGKENWQNYLQDMLPTRVVSAAARLVVDLGGVYTEADFALQEEAKPAIQVGTDAGLDALEAELAEAQVVEPPEMGPSYPCQWCGAPFDSPQALGGHSRGCPKKPDAPDSISVGDLADQDRLRGNLLGAIMEAATERQVPGAEMDALLVDVLPNSPRNPAGQVDVAQLHPQELQKVLDAVLALPVPEDDGAAPAVPPQMQPKPPGEGLFPVGEFPDEEGE